MKALHFLLVLAAAAGLSAACQGGGAGKGAGPAVSAVRGETQMTLNPEGPGVRDGDIDPEIPTIRFISKGSILPTGGSLDLLFGSVSYAKAQVRVKKVYSSNILQFLQLESYETRYELYKIASVVADTTLVLGDKDAGHIREWKTYGLSLDELVTPEPGAIYHIEIRGREPLVEEDFWDSDSSFGDYETYGQRSVDLLASNLVLIAKRGDSTTEVFAYDVLSGKPVSGTKVKLYSFAQQELAKGTTGGEGRVSFPAGTDASFVVATNGKQYAYLDLRNEKALSTSNFDVSGTSSEGGVKAYIFGERGVWRPGDTLHVSVVTLFDDKPLPPGHPVTAELRNPDGQLVQTLTGKSNASNLYHFPFTTAPDAPSGRWRVDVNLGGRTFSKTLRVETIKPNKLDIRMHFPAGYVTAYPGDHSRFDLSVAWLYGAPGSALKVNGEVELTAAPTRFKGWEDYDFQDDARSFEKQTLYYKDFLTGEAGEAGIDTRIDVNKAGTPGMLTAGYTFRAFEPGGDFSTGYASIPLSPFENYVGIKTELHQDRWGSRFILAGRPQQFEVVTVDPDGKATDTAGLHAEIFHVDWSWWWDASGEIASYMAGKSRELLYEKTFSTTGGKARFSYDWADAPSGLYYIRVTDPRGGHAASMLCEVNERSASDASEGGSTQLNMLIDKEKYTVGETARITIPSAEGASALVSIEKGGKILGTRRVPCFAGSTEIRIPVTREMMPNAYATITLIQPHGNVRNDAPIRLYGIRNIPVEDASSRLSPVIDMPDGAKPESTLHFKVRERDGRAMSYVVVLVDEGLLSLTGFKTPDAWSAFYAKEALRVRTWDEYDSVIGAYGGHIEQLFAIGGDEEGSGTLRRQGADRFTPVVAYLGPFELKAGRTASHSVEVPQYIGSLRAMVIATDGRAQGSAARNVNVTQPVMVQATLPRTLSVGETIRIPATVIALRDGVGKVRLDIRTDDLLTVQGPSTLETSVAKAGQQVEYFEVRVGDRTGTAHVTVTATAGSDKSVSRVEIDVLDQNPPVTRVQSFLLDAGKSQDATAGLFGLPGTNRVAVELSSLPAIDLGRRLRDLTEYPYGCVEQTISAAFPQLYLSQVMACDENTVARSARQVTAAINRLHSFRRPDGSLSYWPGSTASSSFGSAYALHFLQEAENQGYAVPADLKSGLIRYLAGSVVGDKKEDDIVRAYGLYALAAAGKPQRSAMNLLRESAGKLPRSAVWLLAGAFASDGKKQVATQLTNGLPYLEADDRHYLWYGSEDRNMAIALRTCILTGQKETAFDLAGKIADRLGDSRHYMSTQAAAWSLYAISDYARTMAGGGVDASVKGPEKSYRLNTGKAFIRQEIDLPEDAAGSARLSLSNTGGSTVHAVVSVTGTPKAGTETAKSNGISMRVAYVSDDGRPVRVDTLSRGRNFKAVVTVTNTGSVAVRDLALAQKFPSGWEIRNDRVGRENFSYPAGVNYQDFRDDRVYSFFDLGAGQSVTVTTGLTATYPGKFYLPAVSCEAMYDDRISALVPGRWTEVK